MDKGSDNSKKTTTPAQGDGVVDVQSGITQGVIVKIEPAPEWATELQKSNAQVVASNEAVLKLLTDVLQSNARLAESNQAAFESNANLLISNESVVAAVADFREAAGDIVKEILAGKTDKTDESGSSAKPSEVDFDENATYVVAKGRMFQDKHNASVFYNQGDDVSHLENERLQNLLSQRIIERA